MVGADQNLRKENYTGKMNCEIN